jgi:hypothetical protein
MIRSPGLAVSVGAGQWAAKGQLTGVTSGKVAVLLAS